MKKLFTLILIFCGYSGFQSIQAQPSGYPSGAPWPMTVEFKGANNCTVTHTFTNNATYDPPSSYNNDGYLLSETTSTGTFIIAGTFGNLYCGAYCCVTGSPTRTQSASYRESSTDYISIIDWEVPTGYTGISKWGESTQFLATASTCALFTSWCGGITSVNGTQCNLSASASTAQNVTCNGGSDGIITVTTTDGTANYTYAWSGPSSGSASGISTSTHNITGLSAGTYSITVTDANSCTATTSSEIDETDAMLVIGNMSVYGNYNISCKGEKDGWIDLTVLGGNMGTLSYDWSPDVSDEDYVDELGPGRYSVTVTDPKGCTDVFGPMQLSEPRNAIACTITQGAVSANGGSDGWACVSTSGGNGTITYLWSNGATTSCASGLSHGTYTVTMMDGHCNKVRTIDIEEPSKLTIGDAVTNASCYGKADGAIDISVSGGQAPYSYSWTGTTYQPRSYVSSKEDLTKRRAGTYDVLVTDANGCTGTASYTITQPDRLIAKASVTKPSCKGDADGAIDLTVTGGTTGYSYHWNIYSYLEDISGLSAGTYYVTVTDANGCIAKRTAKVNDPNLLGVSIRSITGDPCINKGKIVVKPSGGTGSKTYSWTGSSSTSAAAKNLGPGNYSVTVTDTKGCTASLSQALQCSQPKAITADDLMNISFYPNPTTGIVILEFEDEFMGDKLYISDLQGRVLKQMDLYGTENKVDLSDFVNGTYLISIEIGNYMWREKITLLH